MALEEGGDWGRGMVAASSPLLAGSCWWPDEWCLEGVCGWGRRESASGLRRDDVLWCPSHPDSLSFPPPPPPPLLLLPLLLMLLLRSEPLAVAGNEATCSLSLQPPLAVLLVSEDPPVEDGAPPFPLEFCCCAGSLGGGGAGAFWAICA